MSDTNSETSSQNNSPFEPSLTLEEQNSGTVTPLISSTHRITLNKDTTLALGNSHPAVSRLVRLTFVC
jgi:hypothetical protein